jgi:hypothetical protein
MRSPRSSNTFTEHHLEDCPFITRRGAQECDEDCYFPHPADAQRTRRMIPTTADFHDETGRQARWLGTIHGNAGPKPCGASTPADSCWTRPDPATFADAVLDLLDVFPQQNLGPSHHHPRDRWPWSSPDSRSTD